MFRNGYTGSKLIANDNDVSMQVAVLRILRFGAGGIFMYSFAGVRKGRLVTGLSESAECTRKI